MKKTPSILVVDDEPQILRVLRTSLPPRGFQVRVASDAMKALDEFRSQPPDLIILDLVLPEVSGIAFCREIRQISDVPIIILSAKGSEKEKVLALEMGADDYITKPFGMDELVARIRAVMRRSFNDDEETHEILEKGGIRIDLSKRQVLVSGEERRLTPKEYEVLVYLMRNAGKVVTHHNLLRAVWGWQSEDQVEYLRVFINQLRKKIENDPRNPRYIKTEPWVGYRFLS